MTTSCITLRSSDDFLRKIKATIHDHVPLEHKRFRTYISPCERFVETEGEIAIIWDDNPMT